MEFLQASRSLSLPQISTTQSLSTAIFRLILARSARMATIIITAWDTFHATSLVQTPLNTSSKNTTANTTPEQIATRTFCSTKDSLAAKCYKTTMIRQFKTSFKLEYNFNMLFKIPFQYVIISTCKYSIWKYISICRTCHFCYVNFQEEKINDKLS